LCLALAGGCGSEEVVESQARDRDIAVDGSTEDWDGMLHYLEDAELSYGIANDAMDLYIVLVVGDRNVRRQIMLAGLYLWFDPAGEESKQFGLRFPIGMQVDAASVLPMLKEEDPNKLQEGFDESVKELMIIQAGEAVWRRTGVKSLEGIEVAAAADQYKLVLEFRVPIEKVGSYGYGIGARPGALFGFGVETPEIDMEEMKEQMRASRGGGGKGGGGGGRGGTGGMRPPGGQRPDMPDPIKKWTRVQLAPGGAQS